MIYVFASIYLFLSFVFLLKFINTLIFDEVKKEEFITGYLNNPDKLSELSEKTKKRIMMYLLSIGMALAFFLWPLILIKNPFKK